MPFTAEQKRERRAQAAREAGREPGQAGRPAAPCAKCARPSDPRARHSCPDFPLPSWAPGYLAAFDAYLQAPDGPDAARARERMRRILRAPEVRSPVQNTSGKLLSYATDATFGDAPY